MGNDAANLNAFSGENTTMQLNLSRCDPELQKSLVVHEFGHALGLKHEHQRSDFWEVLEKHLDIPKMKRSVSEKYSISSEQEKVASWWDNQWNAEPANSSDLAYDPLSIMHYR